MAIKIEEAFNQCFERLSAGESLDSCLRDYEEYRVELDLMLRTAYDVKRRAYPVQPRPEFKYWARVRLQGVQDYARRQPVQHKPVAFDLRRTMAISMAALLVFVIASSGTVAASSGSLPDEPLYGVKLAVEQAQVTLTFSDVDKAEVYAHLAEKRAGEIVALASQGKTDKIVTTTAKMDYQLQQAEQLISKYEVAIADVVEESSAAASVTSTAPAVPSSAFAVPSSAFAVPSTTSDVPAPPVITIPIDKTTSTPIVTGGQQDNFTLPAKPVPPETRESTNISRAKNTMNTTTAKSLALLQKALEKAPDSSKSALEDVIQHTKKANERAQQQLKLDTKKHISTPGVKYNTIPAVPADKPKYIPPVNNNHKPAEPLPVNKPTIQTNTADNSSEKNSYYQTDTSGDRDHDNKYNQTQPGSNLRLPAIVNPITK